MIRRDIRLADGSAAWMLISQIEHARLSADLAARCTGPFGASSATPANVRDELLAAIRHHDDGWAAWEQSPQFDSRDRRPLSFNEIDVPEAIAIWSGSIAAAEAIGPLAAWMVAGHFLRLAANSDSAPADVGFAAWRDETEKRRVAWLAAWRRRDLQRHTPAAAQEALQWLWTFDEASLWLCCTCKPGDAAIPCAPQPYCAGRDTPLEMTLQAACDEMAVAAPWRFDRDVIHAVVNGRVVSAARYGNAAELLACAVPHRLTWRLTPPERAA
jgi:hypothetical protein